MTRADKLKLMETLWDDLCRDEARVISPGWHGGVLAARARRIQKGSAKFSDWDEAKKRLRRRVA